MKCASSLQAVISAVYQIAAGDADIVMAGGVEVMSRMPFYFDPSTRYTPFRLGEKPLYDTFTRGVTLVQPQSLYPGTNMGITAENVAELYNISRQEQDEFSAHSQKKYKDAFDS